MDSEGEYHKKKPYQMGETLNSHQSFNTKPYVGRVMYEGNGSSIQHSAFSQQTFSSLRRSREHRGLLCA